MKLKYYSYGAVLLLFGGFIAVGAAAGIRVGIAEIVIAFDCPATIARTGPTVCQGAIQTLNQKAKILLLLGGFQIAGGIAIAYWLKRQDA